jgi:hypothetical protein
VCVCVWQPKTPIFSSLTFALHNHNSQGAGAGPDGQQHRP